jgi:hypothetical protein
MTAHRNVHLAKNVDHFVSRNSELTRHVRYTQLTHPVSPCPLCAALTPRANLASRTPTTAVAERPTTLPSSSAEAVSIIVIPRPVRSGTILSRLFGDASEATTASRSVPLNAASLALSTPTATSRPRAPRPSRRNTAALPPALAEPLALVTSRPAAPILAPRHPLVPVSVSRPRLERPW